MKITMTCALLVAIAPLVAADEVVLANGKVIQFRILKDAGDSVEIHTVENQTVSILKKDVKEVKLTSLKAPLTGATFTGDKTSAVDKPVNLLAMIDPKKHGSSGEWRLSAGGLVGGGTGSLETPYIPVGSAYDVEISVERKGGDNEFHVGLVMEGIPFSLILDWGKGQANGLSCVAGKRVYENDTNVGGKQLVAKKPRHIICAVRPDRVVVLMDGKEFVNWVGDVKQLSHPGRPVKAQNLFLSSYESSFSITKYVVTPRK